MTMNKFFEKVEKGEYVVAKEVSKRLGVAASKQSRTLKKIDESLKGRDGRSITLNKEGLKEYIKLLGKEKEVENIFSMLQLDVVGCSDASESGEEVLKDCSDDMQPGRIGTVDNLYFIHNDTPYFNVNAIGLALEIDDSWKRRLVSRLSEKGYRYFSYAELKRIGYENPSPNGCKLLTESGLYQFILKSSSPKALSFQDWVCCDLIPSIRKEGRYDIVEEQIKKNCIDEYETALRVSAYRSSLAAEPLEKLPARYKGEMNSPYMAVKGMTGMLEVQADMQNKVALMDRDRNINYGTFKELVHDIKKLDEYQLEQVIGTNPHANLYNAIYNIGQERLGLSLIAASNGYKPRDKRLFELGYGTVLYVIANDIYNKALRIKPLI